MNFKILPLIVYLCGELKLIFAMQSVIQTSFIIPLANESMQKRAKIKFVYDLLYKSLSYRYAQEERARVEANIQINEFESETRTEYTKSKPSGSAAMKLWDLAQQAEKNYIRTVRIFEWERLTSEPEQQFVCKAAMKNSYFKKENLITHTTKYGSTDCTEMTFSFWNEKWHASAPVNFTTRLKKCYAMKVNEDKTKVEVAFYMHSVFKKPAFGRVKYFVLFGYVQNPKTGEWEMATDSNSTPETIRYRYEARLTMGIRDGRMVDLPWRGV